MLVTHPKVQDLCLKLEEDKFFCPGITCSFSLLASLRNMGLRIKITEKGRVEATAEKENQNSEQTQVTVALLEFPVKRDHKLSS